MDLRQQQFRLAVSADHFHKGAMAQNGTWQTGAELQTNRPGTHTFAHTRIHTLAHTHTHPVAEAVSHGPTEPLFPPHVRTTCIDRVC